MNSSEQSKLSLNSKRISRRAALKKVSKYAAVTALGTFLILNPQKAQAASGPPAPGDGF